MRTSARTVSSAAAVAILASIAFSPTAQADVIGSCRLVVPATVRIQSPYQHISASVTGGCSYSQYSQYLYAAWDGYTSAGMEDFLWFNQSTVDAWDIDDSHTLGLVTWRPDSAASWNENSDSPYNEFTQNAPTSDIRLGRWVFLLVQHVRDS